MKMRCETCGGITERQVLCPDSNKWHVLCPNCASQVNSCAFCKQGGLCDFETNPSKLPKAIQKQECQGSFFAVTTVKNPERIAITCKNGCKCYNEELEECMKEFNYCEKINHRYAVQSDRVNGNLASED